MRCVKVINMRKLVCVTQLNIIFYYVVVAEALLVRRITCGQLWTFIKPQSSGVAALFLHAPLLFQLNAVPKRIYVTTTWCSLKSAYVTATNDGGKDNAMAAAAA